MVAAQLESLPEPMRTAGWRAALGGALEKTAATPNRRRWETERRVRVEELAKSSLGTQRRHSHAKRPAGTLVGRMFPWSTAAAVTGLGKVIGAKSAARAAWLFGG